MLGLPKGVINFVSFRGKHADVLLNHPDFAGLHFTGGYETLVKLWMEIAQHLPKYKNFPRIVGETGGKDFIFVHHSADIRHVVEWISSVGDLKIRGRNVPQPRGFISKKYVESIEDSFKGGDIKDYVWTGGWFSELYGSSNRWKRIWKDCIIYSLCSSNPDYEIIAGGTYDKTKGWVCCSNVD